MALVDPRAARAAARAAGAGDDGLPFSIGAPPASGPAPGSKKRTRETAEEGDVVKEGRMASNTPNDPVRRVPNGFAMSINPDLVRGVTRRDKLSWELFRALARGDFHHDFGERVDTRDLIVAGDENRFFEIAKLVSKKGAVWLRTNFREKVGKTLFEIIGDGIDKILPATSGVSADLAQESAIREEGTKPGRFADENTLLKRIGIDWPKLKGEVSTLAPDGTISKEFPVPGIDGGRKYEIRACPYRLGNRGEDGYNVNTAPIDALQRVAPGKTNFALIVDASGGFPLSDLLDRNLIKGAGGGKVYIIENIENSADSATKLTNIPEKPKPGTASVLPAGPTLQFLRDQENTVNYPLWNNPKDQKSNIYSTFQIVLNRVSNTEVEANLLVKDAAGQTTNAFSIGDVSNTSNVKNATLYALAVILEKGIGDEALIYTLIKRMGDWCQALSLLDLDRAYIVYSKDGNVVPGAPGRTTLRALQIDTEIGIVTNDRILLAFSILLGLNVFYTSAMDIARLIYFKNTNDLPEGNALKERVVRTKSTLTPLDRIRGAVSTHKGYVAGKITEKAAALNTYDLPDYILRLRAFLSNVGRLRLDFDTMLGQLAGYSSVVNDTVATDATMMVHFNAANGYFSLQTKIDLDIAYNASVFADLDANIYPNSQAEAIRIDALKRKLASGGRISKSVEVTEAKNILLETRADIRQLMGKVGLPSIPPVLRATFPAAASDRAKTNYDEILSVLPALTILFPVVPTTGGQRGGALSDILFRARRAVQGRSIRILPGSDSAGTTIIDEDGGAAGPAAAGAGPPPLALEVSSTVNIYKIGDQYYDEKLKAYTVVDEYVVTEDDLVAFKAPFDELQSAVPDPEQLVPRPSPLPTDAGALGTLEYMSNRYLLLLLDIAWNDLDAIEQEYFEAGERVAGAFESSGLFESGAPTRTRINQIIEINGRMAAILAAGGGDFLVGTLTLYFNPATGEEDQDFDAAFVPPLGDSGPFQPIRTLKQQISTFRDTILENIESMFAPGAERAETATLEQNIARGISLPDSRIVDPLVIKILPGEALGERTITLGDIIRGAIVEIVTTESYTPGLNLATAQVRDIARLPGLTQAIQRAVFQWGGGENAAVGAIIATHIASVQGDLDLPPAARVAAIPQRGGFQTEDDITVNAGGSSTRSSRRGLYEGLRKRGGAGTDSAV